MLMSNVMPNDAGGGPRLPSCGSDNEVPGDAATQIVDVIMPPMLRRGSKVLVTGATGFIGGRLVERLLEQHDARIRCTIRGVNTTGRLRSSLSVELVQIDLCNAAEVNRAVDSVDYVFHCAYDWQSRRQNINGLRNLIAACLANSIKRLVHVSTFAVYKTPDGPLTEETPHRDRWNAYVDTKLDLENIVLEAVQKNHLPATIIQPTIVYGPFCVPWTITPAEELIFGNVVLPDREEGICNAVYVDDVVDALILAAMSPAAIGNRFLVSGPNPVTWEIFFTEIARSLEVKPPTFLPREQIARLTQESYLKRLTQRLIKLVARRKSVRLALRASRTAVSSTLQKVIRSNHPSSRDAQEGDRLLRKVLPPRTDMLGLYCSRTTVGSEKARAKLGYRPRFDFQRGMALTSRYLKSVYGDLVRSRAAVATGQELGGPT